MQRREFLTGAMGAAGAQAAPTVPPYLKAYAKLYAKDPHAAAMEWFENARFGLFMHYGLYAHLGRGEWVMLRERIPVAEYKKLTEKFTADSFDADSITGLAVDAGMKYITITTKHHDGFCLFNSNATDYTSFGRRHGAT